MTQQEEMWMPEELEDWLLDNPALWVWADGQEGGAIEFPDPSSVPPCIIQLAQLRNR